MIDVQELAVFLVVFVAFVLIAAEFRHHKKHVFLVLAFSAILASVFFTNIEEFVYPEMMNAFEHVSLAAAGVLFAVTAYRNHIHTEQVLATLHKKLRARSR
ncbi:hypothetical protein C4580_06115 [Candidatus Woesearchaeota archaeon]|nr:MAG: hypothetical protein C4580_06115 [Candidatus Woesearchaeota archaeon]